MTASKVLVACPNHVVKEYSFQRWIDAVTNLTYPNYDILVVDNSPAGELAERYGAQVPIVVVDASDPRIYRGRGRSAWSRVNWSMEVIRQHFLAGDYSHWMNIESDVIPAPDVIEVLLEWGRGSELIAHAYPDRGSDERQNTGGIGCSLFSRRLIEAFSWQDAEGLPDNWLLHQVMRQARTYRTVTLCGHLEVEHLEDPLADKKAAAGDFARRVHDARIRKRSERPRFARRARQFAGWKAARLFDGLAERARQF